MSHSTTQGQAVVLSCNQDDEDVLARYYPLGGTAIPDGAMLLVADEQLAMLVHQGQIADLFRTGMHRLAPGALPVLRSLKNWERYSGSPLESELCFFDLRAQVRRPWQSMPGLRIASRDIGLTRLCASGNFSYRLSDPCRFFGQLGDMRESCLRSEVEARLLELIDFTLAHVFSTSQTAFLELVADLPCLSRQVASELAPAMHRWGFALDDLCITTVMLADELQRALEERHRLPAGEILDGVWMDSILQWQGDGRQPRL